MNATAKKQPDQFLKNLQMRNRTNSTLPELIAPCGINCRLCRAYIRNEKACPGCRGGDTNKSKSCVTCKIKNCEQIGKWKIEYCFDCDRFPCDRLAHLDKRYRTNYGTSAIDNLINIKKFGISWFVENENKKWTCPECGEMICMHKPQCLSCGYVWKK